jgi:Protein of unknown function (DUF3352)
MGDAAAHEPTPPPQEGVLMLVRERAPRPSTRPRPRRPRRRWRAPLVAVAGLLLAGLLAACATLTGDRISSLSLTPESAQLVVRFAPSAGQLIRLQALRNRLETIPEIGQSLAGLEQGANTGGISFQADILPWLGPDMTLAAWAPEGDPQTVEGALIVASRDLRASNRFLLLLREESERFGAPLEKRQFAGVTFYTGEDGPALATLRGFVVIASSTEAMKEVIGLGRNRGGPGLAEAPAYLETMALLPSERILDFYLAPTGPMATGPLAAGPTPERLALGLSLAPDGIAVDTAARYDLEALDPATRAVLLQGPNPLRALGAMPDETVGAVAIRDLRAIWAAAAAPARGQRDFQEGLSSFERSTGLNLEEDIISWLDGEIGLAAVEPPAGAATAGMPVGGLLVVEVTDRPRVEAKMAKIAEALGRQGVTFAPRQIGGVTMQVAEGRGAAAGGGFGYVGDFLVVGSPIATLGQAAEVGAGALPATPRFQALRAALPGQVRDLTYLDVNAIRRIAGAVATAQGQGESYRRQVEPWLRPFAAVGGASAVTTPDGAARARLFALLEPEFGPGGDGPPAVAAAGATAGANSLADEATAEAIAQVNRLVIERVDARRWRDVLQVDDPASWRAGLARLGVTDRSHRSP